MVSLLRLRFARQMAARHTGFVFAGGIDARVLEENKIVEG
jgi:hypothetical protein